MRRHLLLTAGTLVTAAVVLAGCGDSGSSGTEAPASSAAGNGCAPVTGDTLVVLTDDKNLQNAENLVPIVNSDWLKKHEDAKTALDKLSSVLTTDDLTMLIGKVDLDREKASDVAKAYLKDKGLI